MWFLDVIEAFVVFGWLGTEKRIELPSRESDRFRQKPSTLFFVRKKKWPSSWSLSFLGGEKCKNLRVNFISLLIRYKTRGPWDEVGNDLHWTFKEFSRYSNLQASSHSFSIANPKVILKIVRWYVIINRREHIHVLSPEIIKKGKIPTQRMRMMFIL